VLGFACLRRGSRRSFARFWMGVLVIALLWSLGGYTPFFAIVYAVVPGTKFFRAPSTMFYLVGLALAVFSALGVERVLARDVTRRYAVGWLIAGGVILLLGVTGALTSIGEAVVRPDRADLVRDNAGALLAGSVRSAIFLLATAGVLLALALDRLAPRTAAWVLIALAAVDLWSIERIYWPFSAPASAIYAADPTIDYLRAHGDEPARVLPIPLAPMTARHDPFYLGDALMTHRIRQVLGYHGNELGRYDVLVGKEEGYRQLTNPQLWRLLNVKYLLTNVGQLDLPGAARVAGPAVNAAGDSAYLYTLPGDAPAAWVAPVIVKAPDGAVLGTVLDQRFDPRRAAIFDTSAAVAGQQISALPEPSPVSVRVERFDPGHIELELSQAAPSGSALVVSENYYPGWQATVDGKPAVTDRADFVLIGVALPAGARRVSLRFASAPYERGKVISILALLAALAMIGGGIVVGRKRHA
jgi:Bacterial membrane protein YfhO